MIKNNSQVICEKMARATHTETLVQTTCVKLLAFVFVLNPCSISYLCKTSRGFFGMPSGDLNNDPRRIQKS